MFCMEINYRTHEIKTVSRNLKLEPKKIVQVSEGAYIYPALMHKG